MRAVVASDFGAEPQVMDLPVPEPGPNEILVRIHAAAFNPFDLKVVEGALKDAVPHSFPLVMGSDGAGVVERIGAEVTRFQPGDRVYGQFMDVQRGRGAFATYALRNADGPIAALPDGLSFTRAAALPIASLTALQAVEATGVGSGQTILVNGAAGGVGQSAVQFAAGRGARVVATATSDMVDRIRDLGATEIVDYTTGATTDQVRAAHPEGVDAVVDLVSGPADIPAVAGLVRRGGTLVSTIFALDLDALAANEVTGINLTSRATPENLAELADLAASDKLRVRIDAEVPLPDAPAALERARSGHARGKMIIVP